MIRPMPSLPSYLLFVFLIIPLASSTARILPFFIQLDVTRWRYRQGLQSRPDNPILLVEIPGRFLVRAKRLNPDPASISGLTPRQRVIREMENLALIARDGLNELRHRLMAYKAGDQWLPTGGIKEEDMVIPPVVTVLLVGLCGAGKSSLINTMYDVLGRSGMIPIAQTSNGSSRYTTMFLEKHNVLRSVRNSFCMYDSRGLEVCKMIEGLKEVDRWMSCGVRHYQPCLRPGDEEVLITEGSMPSLSSARFNTREVNGVLVVVDALEIHDSLKAGDSKALEALAELFRCPAIRKSNKTFTDILNHISEPQVLKLDS